VERTARHWKNLDAIGPAALPAITRVEEAVDEAKRIIEESEIDRHDLPKKRKIERQIKR